MADVNRGNRPLSPHLQIYRPQLTSMSSIMVRITGIGLLFGAVLVVWWLLAASTSAGSFAAIDGFL
ncbi:MAG: succinate dehydrogenase, cytochrome b556 subunit, partial [Pseudomonadota bacterium]